MTGHNISTS